MPVNRRERFDHDLRPGILSALAADVQAGRRSAEELVRESFRRIEAAKEVNAVVRLRTDEALADARAIDAAARRGEAVGPLAGLPLLVKDVEDVVGMPTTYGSLLHVNDPPVARDSFVPSRLRAAGAIVVGKTNTPEFAFEAYTDNRVFGATRNPWAMDSSPGGSSGGSAAALAAGLAAIATASDGGGSIRIPAALCGLVGIKPTAGIIGRDSTPDWIDLSTDGPFAVTVDDLALLLEIEAGLVDGHPTSQVPWRLGQAVRPARAYATRRLGQPGPIDPSVERLFAQAVQSLEGDMGIPVEPIELDRVFPEGMDPDDWFRIAGPEQAHRIGQEVIESQAELLDERFRLWIEAALRVPMDEHLSARRRCFRYKQELDRLLGEDCVLITPPLTVAGWSPDGRLPGASRPGLPGFVFNTGEINMTGHPAMVLPAGRHDTGLPFGLQVVGPRFREGMLFGLASAWEAAHPWPLAANGYLPFGA